MGLKPVVLAGKAYIRSKMGPLALQDGHFGPEMGALVSNRSLDLEMGAVSDLYPTLFSK